MSLKKLRVFDVNFEILQSARSMHLFGTVGITLFTAVGALAQNEPGSNILLAPRVARTNAVNLTATNFVARSAAVTNGMFISTDTQNVPPTSILGTNIVVYPITLDSAIQMALTNNYDIQIIRYNPDIAQFNLSGAYG